MTGAEFDQLSLEESRDLELLNGEVIQLASPTARHQLIIGILSRSFLDYFDRVPGGCALQDCEFALAEDTRLRPDIAILLKDRWAALDLDRSPIPLPPDIAIEVISPSERAGDTDRKLWTYLGAGVQEVWQIWSTTRKVIVYRGPNSITALGIGETLSTPLLPGWEMPVSEVFRTPQRS